MRALISIVLVGWICCPETAAESERKWWQFGQGREADVTVPPQAALAPAPSAPAQVPQQPTLPDDSGVEAPEPHWMISSPFAKVSWPRIHMPESPWARKTETNPNRNAWAEPGPDPLKPSPMRRFGQSTRAAWNKTVDAVTPGDQSKSNGPSSRLARRDDRSVWKRMFGSNEPPKKEGSQTIGEFIAQDRIDP
jgi:hypothetical protein